MSKQEEKTEYGKSLAIRIVVADKLGIKCSYVDECKKYLETGKIDITLSRKIEGAANVAVQEIIDKGLAHQAAQMAEDYL